jgi:hypothetical protein
MMMMMMMLFTEVGQCTLCALKGCQATKQQ